MIRGDESRRRRGRSAETAKSPSRRDQTRFGWFLRRRTAGGALKSDARRANARHVRRYDPSNPDVAFTGGANGRVYVWRDATCLTSFAAHEGGVYSLSACAAANVLLSAGADGRARRPGGTRARVVCAPSRGHRQQCRTLQRRASSRSSRASDGAGPPLGGRLVERGGRLSTWFLWGRRRRGLRRRGLDGSLRDAAHDRDVSNRERQKPRRRPQSLRRRGRAGRRPPFNLSRRRGASSRARPIRHDGRRQFFNRLGPLGETFINVTPERWALRRVRRDGAVFTSRRRGRRDPMLRLDELGRNPNGRGV